MGVGVPVEGSSERLMVRRVLDVSFFFERFFCGVIMLFFGCIHTHLFCFFQDPAQPVGEPVSMTRGEVLEKLKKEIVRRKTFGNWPQGVVSPGFLAKAGFFYFNKDDEVQCAFCLGIVKSWGAHDDPFVIHFSKFPRCRFIMGLPVGNVPLVPPMLSSSSGLISYRGGVLF
jgi:hypothetical protein